MTSAAYLPLLALLAVAGCSAGGLTPRGSGPASFGPDAAANNRSNLATQVACRQRVNEIYDRRNRAEIYAANGTVNSPFSSGYQSGLASRGLGDQFAYGQTLSDCERTAGTGSERSVAAPPVIKGR